MSAEMFDSLAVYVPREDSPLRGVIDAASGIVGSPAADWFREEVGRRALSDEGRLIIDYEGNRFGASNIVTWADRVYFAAGRHTEQYPTVARAMPRAEELLEVGRFYPSLGRVDLVEPTDRAAIAVVRWLGLDGDDQFADALERELRTTGTRA